MEQLKIKVKSPYDEQSIAGREMLKMYPDQSTPILDLFVRESIQNSLDAAKKDAKYVEVNYSTGSFNTCRLSESLEGVTNALLRFYPQEESRYLSIRDVNTIGLTGEECKATVRNYEYGNFVKLVYDICNPQQQAGAGGSWGQGKIIYFRLGIGLVFYYSRIFNEKTSRYESRLAGCLMEDQHDRRAILSPDENGMSSGIAWWGDLNENGFPKPITDEGEILEFLQIFNIAPFGQDETGTQIIVPFIDEENLLRNNRLEGGERKASWLCGDINRYLKIAVQKWYFPRLCNKKYKYGCYLRVSCNGEDISKGDMLPLFRTYQSLYNCATCEDYTDSHLEDHYIEPTVLTISISGVLTTTLAGKLSTALVSKEQLDMMPPNDLTTPFAYLDIETSSETDENPAIFTYCRRPGMCVSYRDKDFLLSTKELCSEEDKYILSIFVLNSDNSLSGRKMTLEEYARKSEMANHNHWEDFAQKDEQRLSIIGRIRSNTRRKLKELYKIEEHPEVERRISGLGQVMAKCILPPVGYGAKSSRKIQTGSRNVTTPLSTYRNISYGLKPKSLVYQRNTLMFTYEVKALRNAVDHFKLFAEINSESSNINAQQWEDSGLQIPFDFKKANIVLDNKDIVDFSGEETVASQKDFSCHWLQTEGKNIFGIEVKFSEARKFECEVTFVLEIKSKDLQPIIKAE